MVLPFTVLKYEPKTSVQKIDGAALIVLQEWWGINDTIKAHAQHVSDATGLHVVLPDLYKGKVGLTAEEASHLMNHLDWKVAIQELEQLTKELRTEGYTKIGVMGFCMGGALSLALASHAAQVEIPIQAAVACYGIPPDNFDVTKITDATAIQGHFGGKDTMAGFSDPAAVDELERKLHHLKHVTLYRYPEQGHAFLNEDTWAIQKRKELGFVSKDIDPKLDEQSVRELAWSRITGFLVSHLK
ncbi:dienelactone hydrolase [Halteromyces radiatus]|uniref:dienelactone hydrolase n=1 Tax=Halteromyces radiatus TaxID=101107 RepID=UPI00221E9ADB|nr:dienelactone hydrolase [Halteromyces radiatus]KAI8097763.1 dienelactone hydrolase [Halteromyces radiatus]